MPGNPRERGASEGAPGSIRPYARDDLDALLYIWRTASAVGHPFLTDSFLELECEQIVDVWLPASETTIYEDEEGKVRGFLSLLGNEVGAIFVDPSFHGRGIGRALMDDARRRRPYLELDVFADNLLGRRFYERYGFRPVGHHVHAETGLAQLRLRLD